MVRIKIAAMVALAAGALLAGTAGGQPAHSHVTAQVAAGLVTTYNPVGCCGPDD
jgi:H+/gluconate symporter-like permease